jgi:hypothetical protein
MCELHATSDSGERQGKRLLELLRVANRQL